MRLVFVGGVHRAGHERNERNARRLAALAWLVLAVIMNATTSAGSTELVITTLPELPWSALPARQIGARPLQLSVPRIPLALDDDLYFSDQTVDETMTAVGTTLWSSVDSSLTFGLAVNERSEEEDWEPQDKLFGKLRRYSAVFAYDQLLGFRTMLIIDLISKDKRRGLRQFKIFQAAFSRPIGEGGSLTAGSALLLNGLDPELNVGIRFYLPLGGP
ncbi:MAG TPA: hypothetical protein VED46_16905 [Alphaproteobacteria bacterium]|nr:hypothetical protein [Alphaproteobacteria bacterium]